MRQISSLFFLLLLSANTFGAPKSIPWATIDLPPLFIHSGKLAHEGICDLLMDELQAALPDIKHTETLFPNLRLKRKMQAGEKYCYPCLIHRTTPIGSMLLSSPTMVYLPHVLVLKEEMRDYFIKQYGNPVSLEKLLHSNAFLMGQQSGRMFSKEIQNVLDRYVSQGLEIPNNVGSTTSLMMLITLNRVDFTIEYPNVLNYFNRTNEQNLAWLPIKENSDHVVLGAVGCSGPDNDDFKYEAIEKINAILPGILESERYQNGVKKWFESVDANYTDKYQKYLLADGKYHAKH